MSVTDESRVVAPEIHLHPTEQILGEKRFPLQAPPGRLPHARGPTRAESEHEQRIETPIKSGDPASQPPAYSVAPCRGRTAGTQNPPPGGFWNRAARDPQQLGNS
eukprot:COSAG01_NODE_1266_length_10987_cov_8.631980_8_plen_105_part_00